MNEQYLKIKWYFSEKEKIKKEREKKVFLNYINISITQTTFTRYNTAIPLNIYSGFIKTIFFS